MEDKDIINLYFERKESAITETSHKYGGYLSALAYSILDDREDTAECVNDTYFRAWNVIPPQMPQRLKCFLGRITRNLALNVAEAKNAIKRGKQHVQLV